MRRGGGPERFQAKCPRFAARKALPIRRDRFQADATRQETRLASGLSVLISAALLLWPAVLNGYPLLFGDSGVYIEDGIHLHMSWARPLFYGVFMLPLHLKLTTWPVIVAQALIAASALLVVLRSFVPSNRTTMLIPVTLVLTVGTSLPWFVSQLMPDLFGGLLVLALAILILRPIRLRLPVRLVLLLFASACITMHLSFLPIALTLVVVLWLARLALRLQFRAADLLTGIAVPAIAVAVIVAANTVLIGQASPSPYGKIFLLTRILVDGPGQRALERECPRLDWTLCRVKDEITPDDSMLWGEDSVLNQAGGYRVVAAQAWPVILAAVRAEPGTVLLNTIRNTAEQFVSFRSGDGLLYASSYNDRTWTREFPSAEQARYRAGRQYRLLELIPDWLQTVHVGLGAASTVALAVGTVVALRQRRALGGLYAAILATLLANAFVAGGLSGVYDRYQSRFVWLATFAVLLMLLDWRRPALRRTG